MEELDTKKYAGIDLMYFLSPVNIYSLAYTGKDKKKCPKKVSQ